MGRLRHERAVGVARGPLGRLAGVGIGINVRPALVGVLVRAVGVIGGGGITVGLLDALLGVGSGREPGGGSEHGARGQREHDERDGETPEAADEIGHGGMVPLDGGGGVIDHNERLGGAR